MNIALEYHDAVLYDSDVSLFGEGSWLNDNCINWYFRNDVLFMDPAVVSCMMLQCDEPEELRELGAGLSVESRARVFLPINDNEAFFAGSSHWSLLMYDGKNGGLEHYDSSNCHNRAAADKVAGKFFDMLGRKGKAPPVVHVSAAPQQRNGYDCGMYTVLLARWLAIGPAGMEPADQSQSSAAPGEQAADQSSPASCKEAAGRMKRLFTPEFVRGQRAHVLALVRQKMADSDVLSTSR